MTNKKCPVKATGNKPCTDDCAWYTPFGCVVRVLADQLILAAATKSRQRADIASSPAGKTTASKVGKPLEVTTKKEKKDVH